MRFVQDRRGGALRFVPANIVTGKRISFYDLTREQVENRKSSRKRRRPGSSVFAPLKHAPLECFLFRAGFPYRIVAHSVVQQNVGYTLRIVVHRARCFFTSPLPPSLKQGATGRGRPRLLHQSSFAFEEKRAFFLLFFLFFIPLRRPAYRASLPRCR